MLHDIETTLALAGHHDKSTKSGMGSVHPSERSNKDAE
jgi:hypothetical protein